MAVEWHPDENALYEIDEECMRAKRNAKLEQEQLVFNYFTLLLCLFYA